MNKKLTDDALITKKEREELGRTQESASKSSIDLDITPLPGNQNAQKTNNELDGKDSPRKKKRMRKSKRKLGKNESPLKKENTKISYRDSNDTHLPRDSDFTELENAERSSRTERELRDERRERRKHERDLGIIGMSDNGDGDDLTEDDEDDDDLDWSISTDSESDFEVFGEIREREVVNENAPTGENAASVGIIHYDSYTQGQHWTGPLATRIA